MIPDLVKIAGTPWQVLPAGIHDADLDMIEYQFAYNKRRRQQFQGLKDASINLARSGCRSLYLDGSFVTEKPLPNDYDVCWDPIGVNKHVLDPVFRIFDNFRAAQKAKYCGEFFPSTIWADLHGRTYLDFFQIEKHSGLSKGILHIDLTSMISSQVTAITMIYSDKQYRISRNVLDDLISALAVTETQASGEEWIKDMEVEGLKSQIAEIEADVSHYQQLKTGNICHMQSFSLSALPTMLIEARIATGMSQSDLARVLGIKPQQVQRYEATNYMSASLARLVDVAEILNINISSMYFSETGNNGAVYSWNNLDDIAWHKFPAHEMVKRGWFDIPRGANLVDRVKDYVLDAVGPQIVTALHRKKMRADTLPDEYGLLAWQARVLERAQNIIDDTQLPRFNHDDRWLSELVMLTRLADGPRCAARLLASNGIILVTEKHLTGTYLDGAAMVSASDHPVIGMTLRHDRLDNFWFVLFHELGHVYLHLYDGLRYDFFDDDGSHTRDSIELEADRFALSRLVPDDQWGECLSRFALSEEAVHLDASKLGIDASIIAGRIRKELGNYRILNQLVGLRKVRIQFKEESHDIEQ